MNKRCLFALLIIVSIVGIAGATRSVAMLIRAVQWSEWGRVVLYSVTTAVCVEITVFAASKLKSTKTT